MSTPHYTATTPTAATTSDSYTDHSTVPTSSAFPSTENRHAEGSFVADAASLDDDAAGNLHSLSLPQLHLPPSQSPTLPDNVDDQADTIIEMAEHHSLLADSLPPSFSTLDSRPRSSNASQVLSPPPSTPPDPAPDEVTLNTTASTHPDSLPCIIPESVIAPPTHAVISKEGDETRALMDMFRKMRGMGGEQSQSVASPQVPAPPTVVQDPVIEPEPEAEQAELQPNPDAFLFPWEAEEAGAETAEGFLLPWEVEDADAEMEEAEDERVKRARAIPYRYLSEEAGVDAET